MVNFLRERVEDENFLALIWKFLRAGYMEQWQYHRTYSGTPQGSGVSPILAIIYLDKLDYFMAQYKNCFDIALIQGFDSSIAHSVAPFFVLLGSMF